MLNNFGGTDVPSFLFGTFDWRLHGLHLASAPPINLLSKDALDAENPWIVLASILEHAKTGDHSRAHHLAQFFHASQPYTLGMTSLNLLADMGTDDDLRLLAQAMTSNDAQASIHAAKAARLAGRLWLVPAMIDAWKQAPTLDDRDGVGFAVSNLLESEMGFIAEEASIYRLPPLPPPDSPPMLREYWKNRVATDTTIERFPTLVTEAYNRFRDQFGSDRVTLWRGTLFSVVEFAREFLARIQSDQPGSLFIYRHKFEANTGIDCSDFFVDLQPQLLAMQATLEEFLASDPESRFEPGVRYFFGHRIPE